MGVPVLARGERWAVVAKPSGLAVHRSELVQDRRTLVKLLRRDLDPRANPVHRLDRPTSGCLLVSLDPEYTRVLQAALTLGQKQYLALVRGCITAFDPIRVDHPMKDSDGVLKDASTWLEPIASCPEPRCSLVLARPLTGRFHQIRRHLRDLSHPVLGDSTHGDTRVNRTWREQHGLDRLGLHCFALSVELPDGERIEATCPVPFDLRRVLDGLPLWADATARVPALLQPGIGES